MADDKTKSGGQDRTRIDTRQDYEVRDWSKKFGVSAETAEGCREGSRFQRQGCRSTPEEGQARRMT